MIIGTAVKLPVGVNRVRRVGGGVPSTLTVLFRLIGMIETLVAVQCIMAILVANLACRLGAATTTATTTTAGATTPMTRPAVAITVVVSELLRGRLKIGSPEPMCSAECGLPCSEDARRSSSC
jgi:hypothetical protein